MGHKRFKIGKTVKVKQGAAIPDLRLDISGWQGRITNFDKAEKMYEVTWDVVTLKQMREWMIQRLLSNGESLETFYLEPQFLEAADARDAPDDWRAEAGAMYEAHGYPNHFSESETDSQDDLLQIEGVSAETDDDDFYFEFPIDDYLFGFSNQPEPKFDLERFLAENDIPEKEHGSIRRSLSIGLGHFYSDARGYEGYGKQPAEYRERFGRPYLLGYGILEILNHKRISTLTQLKFVEYTLQVMAPDDEYGVPFGLLEMVGFLASAEKLTVEIFMFCILAVTFNDTGPMRHSFWIDGVTVPRMLSLLEWLKNQQDMPDTEKTFWVWQFIVRCGDVPHLGKTMANHWLAQDAVALEERQTLCWAWLRQDSKQKPGTPPVAWRMMELTFSGDIDSIRDLVSELGLALEDVPQFEALIQAQAELQSDPFANMLRMRHEFVLVPGYLSRLALPWLVRLGEDLVEMAELCWNDDKVYDKDMLNNGIADAVLEFQDRLSDAQKRAWIERAIVDGRAGTRKTWYGVSAELYGREYLERAVNDNSKMVRNWASKKLSKMP